jgi:hypothetical protein
MFKQFFQSNSVDTEPQPEDGDSFADVYEKATIKPPTRSYGILRVAAMVGSPPLAGKSPDQKRNSILMALEAAGAEIDYLLEDAVFRQRALNDREEVLQQRLRDFETAKASEVRGVQAELERLTAQHVELIQVNRDEVAREQGLFRAWQRRKQHESQRIAGAAVYCVPKNNQSVGDGLSVLLERTAASSWR